MITFSDVSFTYTGETKVFSELALSIEEGQFVCVLGRQRLRQINVFEAYQRTPWCLTPAP